MHWACICKALLMVIQRLKMSPFFIYVSSLIPHSTSSSRLLHSLYHHPTKVSNPFTPLSQPTFSSHFLPTLSNVGFYIIVFLIHLTCSPSHSPNLLHSNHQTRSLLSHLLTHCTLHPPPKSALPPP